MLPSYNATSYNATLLSPTLLWSSEGATRAALADLPLRTRTLTRLLEHALEHALKHTSSSWTAKAAHSREEQHPVPGCVPARKLRFLAHDLGASHQRSKIGEALTRQKIARPLGGTKIKQALSNNPDGYYYYCVRPVC